MDSADILLPLDETSDLPLYRQVYEGLRSAILEGRFGPGTRLASTRRLAEYLAVSRTTVLVAFELLAAEGFLESRVGSGSRVSEHLPPPDRAEETGRRTQTVHLAASSPAGCTPDRP